MCGYVPKRIRETLSEKEVAPMLRGDTTDKTIDQIDHLLVTLLDAYTLNGDDRLELAIVVLSWLFTNIVHTQSINRAKVLDCGLQSKATETLCNLLKADAVTNLSYKFLH